MGRAQSELSAPAAKNKAAHKYIHDAIRQKLEKGDVVIELRHTVIEGDYALATVLNRTDDVGLSVLLKASAAWEKWTIIAVDGGAWDASGLINKGVPTATATKLLAKDAEVSRLTRAQQGGLGKAEMHDLKFSYKVECQSFLTHITGAHAHVSLERKYVDRLADDAVVAWIVRQVAKPSYQHCAKYLQSGQQFIGEIIVRISAAGSNQDLVTANADNKTFELANPFYNNRVKASAAAKREVDERQRAGQMRQERRTSFQAKFGVQQLINEEMLMANPFLYKSKVVGVHTTFGRMIAENEALFYHDGVGNRSIIVSGVPPTQFSGARPVVLAITVLGTRAMKTMSGEAILPHGQYVGVFECRNSRCDEFYEY